MGDEYDEESLYSLFQVAEERSDYSTNVIHNFADLRVWSNAMNLAERVYALNQEFSFR